MPILEGTDGVEKMSKSLGNYIGINENPEEIYIKVMQLPDSLIIKYFELATDIHPDTIDRIKAELERLETNPRDIKMRLAKEIVTLYHGLENACKAEEFFKTVFQKRDVPDSINEIGVDFSKLTDIAELIVNSGFALSRSEAKRLVSQGAVKVNGEKVYDSKFNSIAEGDVLQVGKGKLVRVMKIK